LPVATGKQAHALPWKHRPGETAEVTFTRDGISMTTTVTLAYLPKGLPTFITDGTCRLRVTSRADVCIRHAVYQHLRLGQPGGDGD
jgi:hypothetical protein